MSTTPNDIARVAAALPTLGRFGFGLELPLPCDNDFLLQIDTARAFLDDTATPRMTIVGRGAYLLKHRAERAGRRYVSVGAMIAAAYMAGLTPVRQSDGPNCRFVEAPR